MVRERTMPTSLLPFARNALLFWVVCFSSYPTLAQSSVAQPQPSPTPGGASSEQTEQASRESRDPIERSDEFKSKLTLGVYFTNGAGVYDLNLRHQFGHVTAWIAGFYDPKTNKLLRVGAQDDYNKAWFHFVPYFEVSTTRAVAGCLNAKSRAHPFPLTAPPPP